VPYAEESMWAVLLRPDPLARDAVYLADGAGEQPGKPVFSGMRVTFPHWSPDEEKLSVWFTFSPTYRSLPSAALSSWLGGLLNVSLRRGDPAAVFDVKTGKISWMTVNPNGKVQVGHYHLLKRDYAAAWRWYAEAEREMPKPKQPAEST